MNNLSVHLLRKIRGFVQKKALCIFVCSLLFFSFSFFCAFLHYLFPSIDANPSYRLRETGGVVTRTFYAEAVGMESGQYTITADIKVRGFVFDLLFASGFRLSCNLMNPEQSGVYAYDSDERGRLVQPVDLGLEISESEHLGDFCYASLAQIKIHVDIGAGQVDFFIDDVKRGTFSCSTPLIYTAEFFVKEDTFLSLNRFAVEDEKGILFDFSLRPKNIIEFFVLWRKTAGIVFLVFGLLGMGLLMVVAKGILPVVCLLVALLSSEIFLRVSDPTNPRFNMNALIALQDYNFYVLTNLIRNRHARQKDQIVIHDMSYPPKEKVFSIGPDRDEKLTILCLGASPAEARDIKKGLVFSDVLARLIGGRSEAINAAIANFSLSSVAYALNFRDVLMWARADIIVIFASFAPVQVAADIQSFERYRKIHSVLEDFPGWINSPRRAYCALEFKNPRVPLVVSYEFLSRSFLFFGMEQLRKRIFNRFLPDSGQWGRRGERTHQELVESFWLDTRKLYPELFSDSSSAAAPESLLAAVRDLAMRQNPNVRIVLVPEPYTDVPFRNEEVERMFFEMVRKTKDEMTRFADSFKNVVFLDLQSSLSGSAEPVFSDMTHLNELGHDIVAHEIFEKLRSPRSGTRS